VKPSTQAAPTAIDRRSNIRIDTTLVLVPVAVNDPMGRFVTGLDKENFKVFEDKAEQEIKQFSSEDAPMSVGLVFDTSGSMGQKLSTSRKAVAEFLKTANPEDEFFLIQFNDRPELAVPFTPDTEEVQNRLTFMQSKGRTALLDGIYMAMNTMKKARNPRKAILIISDGGDNSSRYTESEVKNAVREADVQIYAIGIFEPMASRGRTPEEMSGPALLGEISEQTGGRHFAVDNLSELPDVAAKIGIELHNQYVLGYTPKNAVRDGKYRRIQVRLVKTVGLPQLKAIFRTGYYAPTQ
jgi:Ca-activated chloride channel family protein